MVLLLGLASFYSNLIAILLHTLHQSTLDRLLFRNELLACSKGLDLSAQELLHDNQYPFRILNILQTSIV